MDERGVLCMDRLPVTGRPEGYMKYRKLPVLLGDSSASKRLVLHHGLKEPKKGFSSKEVKVR